MCTVSWNGGSEQDVVYNLVIGLFGVVTMFAGRNRSFPLSCPSGGVFIETIARKATHIAPGNRIEVIH
jgi:hypothetical protein